MAAEQIDLQVLEYGGTARSGKGTIVAELSETIPGVAAEEAGADYRAVTYTLLQAGDIDPEMSEEVIGLTVESYGSDGLTEIVAARNSIVAEHGLPALYSDDVGNTVWKVSPHQIVRGAVKAGFSRRVEVARDDPDVDVLLIDGRNLSPLIDKIPGTRMIMRTFVSCDPLEAALRECARNGMHDIDEITRAAKAIHRRNEHDAARQTDAVRPDVDSLDYWLTGDTWSELGSENDFSRTTRFGVGMLAVTTGRQIHFDTGAFRLAEDKPRDAMLAAARQMFDEAMTGVRIMGEAAAKLAAG